MKISEAMKLGWEKIGKRQNFGGMFNSTMDKACALGCLYLGMEKSHKPNWPVVDEYGIIHDKWHRTLRNTVKCLPGKNRDTLQAQIIHANDDKKMTIPAIIKGLKKCGL